MNRLIIFLLFSSIYCNVSVLSISSLDDESYNIFLELLKGEFYVPLKERSIKVKSALVRFWRNKQHLSLKGNDVCFKGKVILRKSEIPKVVKKAFKDTKGSGVRKIYHHLKDVCSGAGERDVRTVLHKSRLHQRLNARFQNKAPLKPIRARSVQTRHQIDLISMESSPCRYKGRSFKFILSLLDVFSRYHWLVPLEGKNSNAISDALCEIYKEHGPPKVIQHDQGTEFKGAVQKLCKTLNIKVIQGRPYHPQSQGKVERSHRAYRKKLQYDMLTMGKGGVSWVKAMPDYAKTLNLDPREELAWKSAFEVYYGRKINRDMCGTTANPVAEEWSVSDSRYKSMISPQKKDYTCRENDINIIRRAASLAGKKCENRMVKKGMRNNPASVYKIGENVLIRYPPSRKITKKRSILDGTVLKRNLRNGTYKIRFVYPVGSFRSLEKWISVNDITSITLAEEKRKRKKTSSQIHRQKFLIPISNGKELFASVLSRQHLTISYDPPGNGNCQFAALCHLLTRIGIFRSPETLRKEIVEYMRKNPNGADGFPLELFVGLPWDQYLVSMATDGTFGDHLTLQAMANLFLIQINVYSSLGPSATQIISPLNSHAIETFSIGHFAEGDGEHYVCLCDERPLTFVASDDMSDDDDYNIDGMASDDNDMDPSASENVSHVDPPASENVSHVDPPASENVSHLNPSASDNVSHVDPPASDNVSHVDPPADNSHGGNPSNDLDVDGPFLNYDVLEKIIQLTVGNVPTMRSSLRIVSRFFKEVVDNVPRPRVHLPELMDFADLNRVSVRRIILMRGKGSAVVNYIKQLINTVNWANAWIKFRFAGLGWFTIESIYWKQKPN